MEAGECRAIHFMSKARIFIGLSMKSSTLHRNVTAFSQPLSVTSQSTVQLLTDIISKLNHHGSKQNNSLENEVIFGERPSTNANKGDVVAVILYRGEPVPAGNGQVGKP